ncbi:copper transporter [Blastococcus sp. MG754426]|uniref:copper transporter n=1 Tax=unclassified Blastococcus TaxID=2619396 RepID=UPI001EF00EC8|nr:MULTISPECIES: copper transporter [unclassified Blastococcus]MCF6508588.1 copper transporter [Blastococcus sp. MG754426]MCF6513166.1 copper transporter [Blastococcus sp. MG754427]
MIDFRYHLVSLIAVFLAVALGIVIGTTALNEPILADIENQVAALQQDKRDLEDRTRELEAQLDTSQEFEEAVGPALVAGTLTDRSVLLVLTDEGVAPETVEEVTALIGEAGGSVSGVLRLQPAYTDPASAAALQSYVAGPGLPAGLQLPESGDSGVLVASLLSQVLMVPEGGPVPDDTAVSSVLAGLASLEVLAAESASVSPADHAVVLNGSPFEGPDAEQRNAALVALATALDAQGRGAVVAGTAASARPEGLVGALRADPALAAAVSTVDNVGTEVGRISTVLALGQESQGTSGVYGTAEGAQPIPPVPAAPQ